MPAALLLLAALAAAIAYPRPPGRPVVVDTFRVVHGSRPTIEGARFRWLMEH